MTVLYNLFKVNSGSYIKLQKKYDEVAEGLRNKTHCSVTHAYLFIEGAMAST